MARRRRPPRAGALSELQPLKIAAQIATLQALYYLAALVLFLFTTLVAGMPFSFDLIFTWDRVRGDTTQGWLMAFVWLLDGGFCMYVQRTKPLPPYFLVLSRVSESRNTVLQLTRAVLLHKFKVRRHRHPHRAQQTRPRLRPHHPLPPPPPHDPLHALPPPQLHVVAHHGRLLRRRRRPRHVGVPLPRAPARLLPRRQDPRLRHVVGRRRLLLLFFLLQQQQ